MNTGDALLRAIAAQPDEDTPRLMYADWLDENGQPERAEFIRVQVAHSTFPRCPRTHFANEYQGGQCIPCQAICGQWRIRAQALLNSAPKPAELPNPVAWFAVDPNPAHWFWDRFRPEYRRGFPSAVTCTWEDWRDHADAILAAHPVREVTLTTRLGFLDQLHHPDTVGNFARAGVVGRPLHEFPFRKWVAAGFPGRALLVLRAEWPGLMFNVPPEASYVPPTITGYAA
jgi:uncharacterized protein (TIGR02996 family)